MRLDTNSISTRTTAPQDNEHTPVLNDPAFIASGSPNNRLPPSHDADNDASDISCCEHGDRAKTKYIVGKLAELETNFHTLSPPAILNKTNDLIQAFGLEDEFLNEILSSIRDEKARKLSSYEQNELNILIGATNIYIDARDTFSNIVSSSFSHNGKQCFLDDDEKTKTLMKVIDACEHMQRTATQAGACKISLDLRTRGAYAALMTQAKLFRTVDQLINDPVLRELKAQEEPRLDG